MNNKINFLKYTVCALASSLVFSSCDGSGANEDPIDIGVDLSKRGIDFENALANPDDIAEIPLFLLNTDVLRHGNIPDMDDRKITQLDDGIINSAGELKVDNITLKWDRNQANKSVSTFTLSSLNEFPALDEDKVNYLEGLMDVVIQTAAGSSNSVNQALNNEIDSSTPFTIAAAGTSIGLLTAVGPEPWLDISTAPIPLVLVERNIIYTVTSTNRELTESGTITGQFEFQDRWGVFALLSVEEEGAFSVFDQITLVHLDVEPFFFAEVNDREEGTFTLTLGE